MKILNFVVAGLVAVCTPHMAFAQSSSSAKANEAVRITDARKANAALMRNYSWNCRTELIVKGEVKDIRIELVTYRSDGDIQHTLLNDQSSPLPGGFVRRAMAQNERDEMKEYLFGLRGLLDRYTLPTAGKVLDFMNQAVTSGPDSSGQIQMNGSGVAVPGDSLSIWTNAASRQTSKIVVTTVYQEDVVELTATFKTLQSGLTHVEFAEVSVPAKQLSVQVHNFNYVDNRPAAVVKKTNKPPAPVQAAAPAARQESSLQTVAQKLKDLKSLLDQGLINQSDYDAKKAQILQNM